MQKEMATIEQVAQDNHERARRLMRELSQMQQEYAELKEQVGALRRWSWVVVVGVGVVMGNLSPL